jgi:hypothetical protein
MRDDAFIGGVFWMTHQFWRGHSSDGTPESNRTQGPKLSVIQTHRQHHLFFQFRITTSVLRSIPTMASSTAQRRLLQEYRALTNNPPEGITAGPVSEDDLLYWEALIQGPEGTPFEGGVFPAELKFPKDYPLAPPSMRFLGEVWHPNGMFFLCFATVVCSKLVPKAGKLMNIWLTIVD